LLLAGFALLAYVSLRLLTQWGSFDGRLELQKAMLPAWLTIASFPAVYLLGLVAGYEQAFRRVNLNVDDRIARRRAKRAIVLTLGPRLRAVQRVGGSWLTRAGEAPSASAARAVMRDYLASRAADRQARIDESKRLTRYAGVDGVDEDGRRLDQREFVATKSALRSVAIAQMGWFNNRGSRYRADLADMLAPFKDLPEDHGITVHVSANGHAWWAWRRTITGWCFAMGAAGPPPDEWLHDGPEPPSGFPNHVPEWGSRWGLEAANW
jgi:hypothetical protein